MTNRSLLLLIAAIILLVLTSGCIVSDPYGSPGQPTPQTSPTPTPAPSPTPVPQPSSMFSMFSGF